MDLEILDHLMNFLFRFERELNNPYYKNFRNKIVDIYFNIDFYGKDYNVLVKLLI